MVPHNSAASTFFNILFVIGLFAGVGLVIAHLTRRDSNEGDDDED